jgi:hypothetical protein
MYMNVVIYDDDDLLAINEKKMVISDDVTN